MKLRRGGWEYNPVMLSATVVRVRIPPLLDVVTYTSLAVMSLLVVRGLPTLQAQLMLLGLSTAYALLYRFVFRTGHYEKNPAIYFGSQFLVLIGMLLLRVSFVDGINFMFLMASIHAALVLTRSAASLWIGAYFLAVSAFTWIASGLDGLFAVAFYLVVYMICGVFGHILQQAELAREHNQQLIEELKSTQEKLRDLAVLEERNRLARDLHDSVKQQVFAISMQLSAARTTLSETGKAYSSVLEAERLAQQAGAELTTLIGQLRPPTLERRTLSAALQEYLLEWSRQTGLEVDSAIEANLTLATPVEQALFRVAQESLANVARHSGASKVSVALNVESDNVTLIVEDNGVGFDVKRIAKGVGLDSMKERLAAVNGALQVSSVQSQGTRVIATVRMS